MKNYILALTACTLLVSSCGQRDGLSWQEKRMQRLMATCEDYGLKPDTDAFGLCIQNEINTEEAVRASKAAERAARRNSSYSPTNLDPNRDARRAKYRTIGGY